MVQRVVIAALILWASHLSGQTAVNDSSASQAASGPAFEVATIKPVESDAQKGRYIVMQGVNRFVEKNYTLKLMIAAAYDLNPHTISGGPAWIESDHYDIQALTPGDTQPDHDQQMAMLRSLLADRFELTFHREQKEFSIYALEVAKGGPKNGSPNTPGLRASTAPADEPAALISTVYPDHMKLPARNATMGEFVSMLQRALLDRPVIDKTGLAG